MGGSQSLSQIPSYSTSSGSGEPISKTDDFGNPTNNLIYINNNLYDICRLYGLTTYSMGALNNKKYFRNDIEYTIKCSPQNPFSLNQIIGAYFPNTCNLTYNLTSNGQGNSYSAVGEGGGGVRAYSSISNVSARCRGYNIITLNFTVSFSSSNLGPSLGDGVGNQNVTVILPNGNRVYGTAGNNILIINSPPPIIIEAYCYASNNWPGSPSSHAVSTVIITSV
jgi:hypothetical protein